jgi:signal peptidase II
LKALYLSLSVVIADQISKLFVKGFSIPFLNFNYEGMYHGQTIPIIGDFFRLTFIENPGMAFGYDPGNQFKLLISVFSLIASLGLIFYLYVIKNKSWTLRFSIALILGGAVGNLIDRTFYGIFFDYAPLFYGKVVDFFDVDFFDFTLFGRSYDRWPVFNIADAAVTIGVLVLILFYKKHENEDEKIKLALSNNSVPGAVSETERIELLNQKDLESGINQESISEKFKNGESDRPKEISD